MNETNDPTPSPESTPDLAGLAASPEDQLKALQARHDDLYLSVLTLGEIDQQVTVLAPFDQLHAGSLRPATDSEATVAGASASGRAGRPGVSTYCGAAGVSGDSRTTGDRGRR